MAFNEMKKYPKEVYSSALSPIGKITSRSEKNEGSSREETENKKFEAKSGRGSIPLKIT